MHTLKTDIDVDVDLVYRGAVPWKPGPTGVDAVVARGEPPVTVQKSSRDHRDLRRSLESWLRGQPGGADAAITSIHATTSANGMSSETILFDATWDGDEHQLVARIAPRPEDIPVFPTYDMQKQFDVIRAVERIGVPVPEVLWCETDGSHLGTPFFVMRRVDGIVPPDILPYNFGDSWLSDATREQQRTLQDASVGVLAELHAIENAPSVFPFLEFAEPGETHLHRHVAHTRTWYEFSMSEDGMASPTVERGFEWLNEHWPSDEGRAVLSWGDSRIGNVLFRDLEPVAVLDWEMVGLGPRELDLGWMIYAHRVVEDFAAKAGLPGMPHFMRRDDVAATYETLTGHTPRDLDFYITYAALQWAIVGLRTGRRQVHFGERKMPDDIDKLLINRGPLNRLLDGTYQLP